MDIIYEEYHMSMLLLRYTRESDSLAILIIIFNFGFDQFLLVLNLTSISKYEVCDDQQKEFKWQEVSKSGMQGSELFEFSCENSQHLLSCSYAWSAQFMGCKIKSHCMPGLAFRKCDLNT